MKTHTQTPGTTHFMPPEALKGRPRYGKPVDVFSLGCVALHVMSHQWPEPKDLLPEETMTALTEMQRRDEYITYCTLPALKELVELCLHNKSEQQPEISVVCVKLKELKVTIEKQVPFATDSSFELFDVVRQTQLQNQKLSATNKRLTESLQEKDKQIEQKNKQIKKLQMVNPSTQPLPDIKENLASRKPLDLIPLPPPDYEESDEFGPVPQHTNPSSHFDDDDNQLIKDSTRLGYRNPPEAKSQIQPRAGPPDYPPVTGDYKASDWPPRTTVPAVASYNRDTEFDKTHLEHHHVGAGYPPVTGDHKASDWPPVVALYNRDTEIDKPHLEISRHGQHHHVGGAGYPPVTGGYTPSEWPPSTTGPAVAPHNRNAHVSRQSQYQHVVAGYAPVTAARPSDWPPSTTVPAVTSRNRDPEFYLSRRGQYQQVSTRGLRNKSFDDTRLLNISASDTTKAGGLHSLPSGSMSPSTDQFGSSSSRLYKKQASVNSSLSGGSDRLVPLAVGTTPNSNQITGSDSSPVVAPVPLSDEPVPQAQQASDSKYGKTNLNVLKNKLQHQKEVTQTVVQTGGGPYSQSASNYANAELSASDNTKLVTNLTSLRSKLERTKEGREAMTGGNAGNKADFYNISELPQMIGANWTINTPPDKKPIAAPRKVTPSGLAGKTVHSSSFLLWQCAGCEIVNEVHHTSCISCKLPQGKMADRSSYCEFCQLMIFIPRRGEFKDTHCPRCKQVYETVF